MLPCNRVYDRISPGLFPTDSVPELLCDCLVTLGGGKEVEATSIVSDL